MAFCEYMPTSVFDARNHVKLNGTEALSYLFNYDPSRLHQADISKSSISRSYDSNYIARLCNPRSWTGETYSAVTWDFMQDLNMTSAERDAYQTTWDHAYQVMRQAHSNSEFPCEQMTWIATECGVNVYTVDGKQQLPGKGTAQEQNACLCKSDYFAAADACFSCTALHSGNATLEVEEAGTRSSISKAVCAESGTVTQSIFKYWSLANEGRNLDTTIISDGAQNKTDVSLYYTGGVDFVPAIIQEPAFTRTVDGTVVTMTPGLLAAKAAAAKTDAVNTKGPATATGSAPVAANSAGGAGSMVSGRLMAVALGGLMMV